MGQERFTHRVAVNAYLIKQNNFLLLKRTNPPTIWGPPGGRLKVNENPVNGLKREVYEETGLDIKILLPVTTWFGKFNSQYILSVDYLCQHVSGNIVLSNEHDLFKWLSIDELERDQKLYFTYKNGFQLKDFQQAWQIFQHLNY